MRRGGARGGPPPPTRGRGGENRARPPRGAGGGGGALVPATIDEIERRALEAPLDNTAGDTTRAARALGIGRKTLYRKLRQYDEEQ